MDFKIRPLKLDDESDFYRLFDEYTKEYLIHETLVPAHFDPKAGRLFFEDFKKNQNKIIAFVVETDGSLIGFCLGYIEVLDKWGRSYFDHDFANIYDAYVKSEFRKKGLGKQMVSLFEIEAKNRGLTQITIKDVDTKNFPSQSVCSKQGYSPWNLNYFKKI